MTPLQPLVLIADNAFDPQLCQAAERAWPAADWPGWGVHYDQDYHKKQAAHRWEDMPEPCRLLFTQLAMVDVSCMGLGPLVPDLSLFGGGLHSLSNGGRVGCHLDSSHRKDVGMRRRLNGILFVNEVWDNAWGGSLQLLDETASRVVVEIHPRLARLVLFATNERSWHQVTAIDCPANVQRKTLACWWYGEADGQLERARAQFAEATQEP